MTYDAVDLFAGSGGWDVGMKWLGMTSIGVELDSTACDTRDAAGMNTIRASVQYLSPLWLNCKGFIASPPCQTFSRTGGGSGRRDLEIVSQALRGSARSTADERTSLILEPMRWIKSRFLSGNPYSWIALEQVPECLPVWEAYLEVLQDMGYNVACGVLRAEEYGVPQTRKRAILVASLDRQVALPVQRQEHRYSWNEALGVTNPKAYMESNYRGVVNGRTHTEDGRWELGRRDFGQPSFTITGRAPKIVVPGHSTTRLLPAQMGVLQTFPADFPWRGNLGQQRLQAGNAIPPVLAYVILRQFRNN